MSKGEDIMRQLRSIRRAQEMTQEQLAKRSGWRREEICKWEKGQRQIKLWQAADIAQALGYELTLAQEEES